MPMTDAEKLSRVRMWATLQGIELNCQKSICAVITDPYNKHIVDDILDGHKTALELLASFLNEKPTDESPI